MANWADDLREAGLDPVRDWRAWQRIGALMERRSGLIEAPEYQKLVDLLDDRSITLTTYERLHDAVYMNPEGDASVTEVPKVSAQRSLARQIAVAENDWRTTFLSCGHTPASSRGIAFVVRTTNVKRKGASRAVCFQCSELPAFVCADEDIRSHRGSYSHPVPEVVCLDCMEKRAKAVDPAGRRTNVV